MITKKIQIQRYTINKINHYRAREIAKGKDFIFESSYNENLNQFRWRIMEFLDCGVVFHFLNDWEV